MPCTIKRVSKACPVVYIALLHLGVQSNMRIFIKIVYDIVFVFIWLMSHLYKGVTYFISLLTLRFQEVIFKVSKANLRRKQKIEFDKLNDRHTKIHLKELANLLESRLKKYQENIEEKKFYKLKKIIAKCLNQGDLKSLTDLHDILFDTPENEVLAKLDKFIIDN